ncbi:ribosomal rna small subunit methyltransferase h [Phtheirospermum japonicum]|uniref:Ribosomal rna small subunit methyltransferase h n=1 Tax=Phtheirospermum japonicum TaxID=374723 RepID=A0A830BA02_9LAMI|nr:ribosomal rna small subunit methyltransferase h [Phtheirospermum japonicum]
MAMPTATASAKSLLKKLLFHSSFPTAPKYSPYRFSVSATTKATYATIRSKITSENQKQKQKQKQKAELLVKRRTRSEREIDEEGFSKQYGNDNSAHVPVLLGEVLDVFASVPLKSFVDCTLGAGGHSAAIIQAHLEMEFYVGLDVDPIAHQIAQARINDVLEIDSGRSNADLQVHTHLKNFKSIKTLLQDIDDNPLTPGVQGILMDLGMSSMQESIDEKGLGKALFDEIYWRKVGMTSSPHGPYQIPDHHHSERSCQVNNAERGFSVLCDGPLDMRMNPQASLRAEDILNLWPDDEVGRILRDYGEESNWFSLQKRIVRARLTGGLHSTRELVGLIRNSTSWTKGGRQGWIKTATRVFQALRIAVNDELNTLKNSIYSCFDCLASGGRLAVITFHSLEDRIVKQAFLDIVNKEGHLSNSSKFDTYKEKEAWIKQMVQGPNACVLTKRPITPSESEERLNPRSRSAKLRVIEKV